MSEHYHPIPPEAQQHLEQISHDPTRQHVADHIQKLHLIENLHEQQQPAQEGSEVEFAPTFAGDSERVKQHMSSISEQASAAHSELSASRGAEVSTADVWSRVLERQLTTAAEAKQRGDSEATTSSLVDYLITTELTQSGSEGYGYGSSPEAQKEKVSKILDETIAKGLAPELVEAARQSYGLVHVETGHSSFDELDFGHRSERVKVTSIAHSIDAVKPQLEIVTDRAVSVDPADPALAEKLVAEAVQERVEQLSLEGAVATAKGVALSEQYDEGRKSDTIDHLTIQALHVLPESTSEHQDKAEQLIRLSEVSPALTDLSKYELEFRAIRKMRNVNSHYRINQHAIYPVDEALITLWDRGFKDLAGRILTAGNEITEGEGGYPGGAIGYLAGRNPELLQEMKAEVERRQQECTQKLEVALIPPDNTNGQYSGYSHERYDAESIIHKVMTMQDPERATEIVLGWAKENNAEKILSTLRLMDRDPDEGSGLDLMFILTGKENPLLDLDEVNKVMTVASELSLRHNFPETVARDSALLDDSEEGAYLRHDVMMLHDEFPLELFDNYFSAQKIRFFERVLGNSDPQFVDNMRNLLETRAVSGLRSETFGGAKDVIRNLLAGALEAEDMTKFLEEQKSYLGSLELMMSHPLFEKLKHLEEGGVYNAFNTLLLDSVTTASNPFEGIKNVEAVVNTELFGSLRSLYDIAPSEAVNGLVAEIAGTHDITKLTQEWQGLVDQLKAVAEHPLMDKLRSGSVLHSRASQILDSILSIKNKEEWQGLADQLIVVAEHPLMDILLSGSILHNIAPRILDGILSTENKVAFCETVYASFAKPQPLWKSLTRFTELLVGEKVESLGEKQKHLVKDIPFIRIKLGVSPENAGLDEIEGFEPHSFAELTIEQKRLMAANQLSGLSDAEVAGLDSLTFDRFTDRVKRVLFAYQLQQTVERSRDISQKEQADSRNQSLVRQGATVIQQGDFLHGTAFDSLASILQDGNVAGEARRASSRADSYPYNVDFGIINGAETIQEKIESTISFRGYGTGGSKGGAGQIMLVYKRSPESWMAGQETSPSKHHALIFGGIPSTEITGIVLTDPSATLSAVSRTVVENGFYVPLYDRQGTILFTPDQYRQMRDDLNMSVQIPPENIVDSSVKAEDQRGISEGGLYLFPTDTGPVRYYVKFAENPDHTWTEYAADELYRVAGVAVPDTRVVVVEGRLGRASRWVEEGSELPPSESSTLEDGAAMDMLLANWDVVFNPANTMTVNGKVLRPDSGSALDIWATGVPKLEGTWTDEVRELSVGTDRSKLWQGMRQEYPNLTDEQLRAQVLQIQTRLTDDVIDRVVDSVRRPRQAREELKARLKARRDYMVERVLESKSVSA